VDHLLGKQSLFILRTRWNPQHYTVCRVHVKVNMQYT